MSGEVRTTFKSEYVISGGGGGAHPLQRPTSFAPEFIVPGLRRQFSRRKSKSVYNSESILNGAYLCQIKKLVNILFLRGKYVKIPYVSRLLPLHQW